MSLNLAVTLVESARRTPEHPAILNAGKAITYAELDADASRFANVLAGLGVRRGHKVVLMLPNIPEFAVAYYGILKLGGVVVPANIMYKAREIEYLMTDIDALKARIRQFGEGRRIANVATRKVIDGVVFPPPVAYRPNSRSTSQPSSPAAGSGRALVLGGGAEVRVGGGGDRVGACWPVGACC